jgi:CRP-like cAMP-binding protein
LKRSEYFISVLRKLDGILPLTNEEHGAIQALPIHVKDFKKGQAIAREGDRPTQCCLVLNGTTCISKVTGDGHRQVLIYHFPGDMPDLQSLHLNVLDMTLSAQTACKVGLVSHEYIRALYHRFPRLADALWRFTLIDAVIFREWLLNIGQRSAPQRIAHFICELTVRMKLAGLGTDGVYPFDLTQKDIGDTLGLSNIHVNRVTQGLRRDGLVDMSRNRLRILDWERLTKTADFNMEYLNLTMAQQLLLNGRA